MKFFYNIENKIVALFNLFPQMVDVNRFKGLGRCKSVKALVPFMEFHKMMTADPLPKPQPRLRYQTDRHHVSNPKASILQIAYVIQLLFP